MPNALAHEKSPYLIQHAENPVDWFPWGVEAFEKAKREGKPLFLSVGYSTCHWCHVMAHESFEDPAVAAVLNELFVNVKVDREERPDVDRVHMAFVQATSGHGGWPMSVWLTPDLKPFYGGTYFPPDDNRYGRPGFLTVCRGVAQAWKEKRGEVIEQSAYILSTLERNAAHTTLGGERPSESDLLKAFSAFSESFDGEWGGFGSAPKFPRPTVLTLLFRLHHREAKGSPVGDQALKMALLTLCTMADGGMNDQVGGGFHRYSVDRFWHVPHFEKMLYDQAQLVLAYLEAYQITHDPFFAEIARNTLNYVQREMTDAEGGFYSAEDADSLLTHSGKEHSEGAFYVWSQAELALWLGEDAALYGEVYGVKLGGNAPPASDPHGEFEGKNILIRFLTAVEAAEKAKVPVAEIVARLERCRTILFEARAKRPRPHLDDKIITAWNGLMISAFARAAWVLKDEGYARTAVRAAAFVEKALWDGTALRRNYRKGASAVPGFAEDYAFLIQGLLDLFETGGELRWLTWATQLQARMDALFWDEMGQGYFSSSAGDPFLPLRMKEDYDGAEPSPNSVAALNLLRLAPLRNDPAYQKKAEAVLCAFSRVASHVPQAVPLLLVAAEWNLAPTRQIVLVGDPADVRTQALADTLREIFLPRTVLLSLNPQSPPDELLEQNEFLREVIKTREPAAYVCENFTCQLPAYTPEDLKRILER